MLTARVADYQVQLGDIYGFGPVLLERVAKRWPLLLDQPDLRMNPYRLCDVRGVGFRLADRVGQALGINPTSPFRIEAAADYVLRERENAGDTAVPPWRFDRDLSTALGMQSKGIRVASDRIVCRNGLWSRSGTFKAEALVAQWVDVALARGPTDYDLQFAADGLAADQVAALRAMRRARVFLLTGCPGTGKTRTIHAILDCTNPDGIALAAPTGKAAKRIEQLTGQPALTIHRLLETVHHASLEYDRLPFAFSSGFKFRRNAGNPLDARLIVVDEVSMMDIRLMADLVSALRRDARLLLIGDSFQLPSVGPGAVLRDLVRSPQMPHYELTELKRQDAGAQIARHCRSIRYEKRIAIDANPGKSDFHFQACDDPDQIAQLCVHYATQIIPAERQLSDPLPDIITLTARRTHGRTSAENLNILLRRRLNPSAATGSRFAPGDRVIQLHNDYDLGAMNGDLGIVEEIDRDANLVVRFETPERLVAIPRQDVDLMHAWALTVHKSQGSEWPFVVVPVHDEQGDFVVSAQHFYTAISRARDGCVVIGPRKWLDHIAANHRDDKRSTRLAGLL